MACPSVPTRNPDATVYVGNLSDKVTEGLLWELFLQVGPVVSVFLPKDRLSGQHHGYAFVEFGTVETVDYAIKIMNSVRLYRKPIRVDTTAACHRKRNVGANLFVSNLAPEVDEKTLHDIFAVFGTIIETPKISRDLETGTGKGFAFICFDCFEASDAAMDAMNGQFLCNRPISISYAFKKGGATGERHGSAVERLLAMQNAVNNAPKKPYQPSQPYLQWVFDVASGQIRQVPLLHPSAMLPAYIPSHLPPPPSFHYYM